MALVFTNVISDAKGPIGPTSSFQTSTTITPVAGDLFVADFHIYNGNITNNGTLIGAGLTWFTASNAPVGSATNTLFRFYGFGAGSTGRLQWNASGSNTADRVSVQVTRVTGADLVAPLLQTTVNGGQDTATPFVNITMSGSSNGLLAAAGIAGQSPSWTAGTGYTELAETTNGGNNNLAVQYRTTSDTNADGTWSASGATSMLVSEIVAAISIDGTRATVSQNSVNGAFMQLNQSSNVGRLVTIVSG